MTAGEQLFPDLYHRLRRAWSLRTSRHWRPDNPAAGQCSVTALVVADELGGDILKTDVDGAWHFYNWVQGRRVDFTASQFRSPVAYADIPSSRTEALADCSADQYQALRHSITKLA